MRRYIAIEGNIGAGKTSLAKKLAEKLGASLLPERFEENPSLRSFYENPEKHAFATELNFLADRYWQLSTHLQQARLTVSDYWFNKCLVFARQNLREKNLAIFTHLFHAMNKKILQPDTVVFLKADIEQIKKNIRSRGRPYEQSISGNYLQRLQQGYSEELKNQGNIAVILLHGNPHLALDDEPALQQLVKEINKKRTSGLHQIDL